MCWNLVQCDDMCCYVAGYFADRLLPWPSQELRDQKPTLSELKDRAEQTKADIDKFASQADYGRAGSLQVPYSSAMLYCSPVVYTCRMKTKFDTFQRTTNGVVYRRS